MGMILGFFLVAYIAIAVGIYLFIKHYVGMKWVNRITLAILILIPTYDIIITNVLAGYYCFTTPSTYINKKVEYPESIYFEDNIFGGFNDAFADKYGNKSKYNDVTLMLTRYLDGVHVKKIALNMPNGKVKVFKATLDDWADSREIAKMDEANASLKYKIKDNILATSYSQAYYNARAEDAKKIASKGIVYDKPSLPYMNYIVTYNEIKLPSIVNNFLYSDEIKMIESKTNKTISYNRRIMHFFYNITLGYLWNSEYYTQEPICGNNNFLFRYQTMHNMDTNEYLYKKYIKGE